MVVGEVRALVALCPTRGTLERLTASSPAHGSGRALEIQIPNKDVKAVYL